MAWFDVAQDRIGDGLSWKRQWPFGLHQTRWISGLSDEQLASQEGLLRAVGLWFLAHPSAIIIHCLSQHSALLATSLYIYIYIYIYICHQITCPGFQQDTFSLQGAGWLQQRSPAQRIASAAHTQMVLFPLDGSHHDMDTNTGKKRTDIMWHP